jgi:hypothetical protein
VNRRVARRSNDNFLALPTIEMLVPRHGQVVNAVSLVCTILVGKAETLAVSVANTKGRTLRGRAPKPFVSRGWAALIAGKNMS